MSATTLTDAEKEDVQVVLRDCKYWLAVCRGPQARRPCVITLALLGVMIGVYYVAGEGSTPGDSAKALIYRPGPDQDWYRSLSAMFSHVNDEHLWMNSIMLFLLGGLFELTEGIVHTGCCVWAGGTLGFALHGVHSPNTLVRGMSGAIYAIMFAQVSLLALNWKEMPGRWGRLFIIGVLGGVDIVGFMLWRSERTSYAAHCFGALAGICVALVLGKNVRLRKWEISMTWAGCGGYAALVATALIGEQTSAGLLAGALLPVLVGYALWLTPHAMRLECCKPDHEMAPGMANQQVSIAGVEEGVNSKQVRDMEKALQTM